MTPFKLAIFVLFVALSAPLHLAAQVAEGQQPSFATTTLDGEPQVAEGNVKLYRLKSPDKVHRPLLGEIRDYDGGATDLQVGPVTFALIYCDHVVIYRFTPLSHDTADCDITWLVRGDAEEGRDYDRIRLTWLWDVTTHADKAIIERNQQGVNSRYYGPGPLSTWEDYTWKFLGWYLNVLKRPADPDE